MLFAIERSTPSGIPVLRVTGELDLTTAPRLHDEVAAELVLQPACLVVDLTPTTFMDSSGARALIQLARRARDEGVELRVVCPRQNSAVRLVIDLLELRAVVPVDESVPRRSVGSAGEEAP